tara:strand:- start:283 stop:1512 length:1230 start_codon:yes stop_codon:yes gene_type:complete
MAKALLTAREVEALRTPKRHSVGDSLYLRIDGKGNKSWLFRYKKHGKKTWLGLGSYNKKTNTLKMAREKVAKHQMELNQGLYPNEEKQKRKKQAQTIHQEIDSTKTFEQCADDWYQRNEPSWSNSKHKNQIKNTLREYAYPYIGKLNVADVTPADIQKCLDPIWQDKTETAKRVRQRIQAVFSYAIASGYMEGLNPARWDDNLANVYPSPETVKAKRRLKEGTDGHHKSMPYAELPDFFSRLKKQDGFGALALQLTILTVSRTLPIRMLTWPELHLTNKEWISPAYLQKNKKEFRYALSTYATELLNSIEPLDDYVFLGGEKGKPSSDAFMSSVLKRMKVTNTTVHGFRATFRTYMLEETNNPWELIELGMQHKVGSATERAYIRGDGFKKRLQMMEDWGNYCTSKIKP